MKPRVTFVSSHAQLAGSEKVLGTIIEGLSDQVHDVVCLRSGPFVADLQERGMRPHVIEVGAGPLSIASGARFLRRRLSERPPDVIHANGVKAALVAVVARPTAPIVWWKHDFSWDGFLARAIARRCRMVAGVSEAVLQAVHAVAATVVIHPGISVPDLDKSEARARVRSVLGFAADAPIVSLVGRLHPVKGHRDLLTASAPLEAEIDGLQIVFVGADDPDQKGYRDAIATEASGSANVHLLGERDDVLDIIAASDAIAIPSGTDERGMGKEGFPLVAIEAMSLGTPVVAYSDGGLPELLGDCGILVPPGDSVVLAEGLRAVLTGDGTIAGRDLASCGRARAASLFTPERMVTEASDLYNMVAASPG